MSNKDQPAQAEGEAVSALERIEGVAESLAARTEAAIERWYARHFHAAVVSGRNPISADDKAALIQSVADAVAPAPKE